MKKVVFCLVMLILLGFPCFGTQPNKYEGYYSLVKEKVEFRIVEDEMTVEENGGRWFLVQYLDGKPAWASKTEGIFLNQIESIYIKFNEEKQWYYVGFAFRKGLLEDIEKMSERNIGKHLDLLKDKTILYSGIIYEPFCAAELQEFQEKDIIYLLKGMKPIKPL